MITHLPALSQPPSSLPPWRNSDRYKDEIGNYAIVIDNGSSNIRYGFAGDEEPFSNPNVIAKYKERKTNKPLLLFGHGVDLDSGSRAQARTPWEGDVLLNFDAL
ncbi:hypothetical protein H0H87_006150, partial [Tephrocybe sp. NHM501043]